MRAQNFGPNAGSPDAAPSADFDHDGIPNAVEYALATDPTVAQSTPSYAVALSGTRLKISFRRSLQTDAGLTIRVSATSNLVSGTWNTLATKTGGNAWVATTGVDVTDNPNSGAVTVTDVQPPVGQTQRFLRITAELAGY